MICFAVSFFVWGFSGLCLHVCFCVLVCCFLGEVGVFVFWLLLLSWGLLLFVFGVGGSVVGEGFMKHLGL